MGGIRAKPNYRFKCVVGKQASDGIDNIPQSVVTDLLRQISKDFRGSRVPAGE